MAKKLTTLLQYLFFLGLGIFLVWWSLHGLTAEDKQQISNALLKGNFWFAVPGIIILLLSHWVRALRWRLLMEPIGYAPSKANTFFAVMTGYLANQAVPRLGEVLRCSTLTRYENIPLDKLLGTVILERVVDALSLLLLFIIALLVQPELYDTIIYTFFTPAQPGKQNHVSLYIIAAIAAAGIITVVWLSAASRKSSRWALLIKKIASRVWEGMISIKSLKKRWTFVFLTIALWSLYTACVYVGFLMFSETRQYGLKEALTVLCAGSLGMIATPGGIGAYAFLVQKTMKLYQLNSGIGLALGWLLWILQTGAVLVAGSLSLLALPIYNKRNRGPIDHNEK